jgi:hypothetical protein
VPKVDRALLLLEDLLPPPREIIEWEESFPDLVGEELLGYLFEFLRAVVVVPRDDGQFALEQNPQDTSRSSNGFVFTPYAICKKMVMNALSFFDQENAVMKRFPQVIDPACGGGAFLIAFARVLAGSALEIPMEDVIQQAIFGVDLDLEAVHITRWSLWCLAGSPDLDPEVFEENIAAGNSILPLDAPRKLDPFQWDLHFATIMEAGGFDVVIGNPPYVRQEKIRLLKPYLQNYQSYSATADLYVYFYDLGIKILKQGGILSLITSNSFLRTKSARPLRGFLSEKTRILDFFDAFQEVVFEANVTPCILTVQKSPAGGLIRVNEEELTPQNCLGSGPWSFLPAAYFNLLAKIQEQGTSLAELCDVYFCIKPGRVGDFVLEAGKIKQLGLEEDFFQPVLRGTDIKQYGTPRPQKEIFFPYTEGTFARIEFEEISENCPRLADYLSERSSQLEARDDYRRNQDHMKWYELRPCNYYSAFRQPKVVTPDICRHNCFTVDYGGHLCLDTIFMIRPKTETLPLEFLAGYLNSCVVEFFLKMTSSSLGAQGFRYKKQFLGKIPVITEENFVIAVSACAQQNLREEAATRQEEINGDVCNAFHLTPEEREIISQFLAAKS